MLAAVRSRSARGTYYGPTHSQRFPGPLSLLLPSQTDRDAQVSNSRLATGAQYTGHVLERPRGITAYQHP